MFAYEYGTKTPLMNLVEEYFNRSCSEASKEIEYSPVYDIKKDDSGINVTIELPGVKKESVDISIDSDTVIVKAERNGKKSKQQFITDKTLDKDAITASMEDGILTLRLPNKAEAVARKIKIT